jgi:hypothetical protein
VTSDTADFASLQLTASDMNAVTVWAPEWALVVYLGSGAFAYRHVPDGSLAAHGVSARAWSGSCPYVVPTTTRIITIIVVVTTT